MIAHPHSMEAGNVQWFLVSLALTPRNVISRGVQVSLNQLENFVYEFTSNGSNKLPMFMISKLNSLIYILCRYSFHNSDQNNVRRMEGFVVEF